MAWGAREEGEEGGLSPFINAFMWESIDCILGKYSDMASWSLFWCFLVHSNICWESNCCDCCCAILYLFSQAILFRFNSERVGESFSFFVGGGAREGMLTGWEWGRVGMGVAVEVEVDVDVGGD